MKEGMLSKSDFLFYYKKNTKEEKKNDIPYLLYDGKMVY